MWKSNGWCCSFTFQCPGKSRVSRAQLCQVSEKKVLHEGSVGTPLSFTRREEPL